MQLRGKWTGRGRTWLHGHYWWYEILEAVLVDTDAEHPTYSDEVLVSQCKLLTALDPQEGDLLVLDVARLEADYEDTARYQFFGVTRHLAFGVTAARRMVRPADSTEVSEHEIYLDQCGYHYWLVGQTPETIN